jgi:hypothetical protein
LVEIGSTHHETAKMFPTAKDKMILNKIWKWGNGRRKL